RGAGAGRRYARRLPGRPGEVAVRPTRAGRAERVARYHPGMERKQWLYVARLTRPDMLTTGPTAAEQATVSRHAAHCDAMGKAGVMLMVGRTQIASPETMGLCVFLAKDE